MALIVLAVVAVALVLVLLFGQPAEEGPTPSPTASPTGSPTETPAATATPVPAEPVVEPPTDILPPGSVARVITDGLNFHREPGTGAEMVATLAEGELVAVGYSHLAMSWGPVEADGLDGYPVLPLGITELPPAGSPPFRQTDALGWVAAGDASGPFVELVPPRCLSGDPEVVILQSLLPWERLACYGDRSITISGVFGGPCCAGVIPGSFEPEWLAVPETTDFLSPEGQDQAGPMTLHFPPDVDRPDYGSIISVTGHFDDPAAAECLVASGEPPEPIDDQVAELYCRERFVVESFAFG